jgi:hypothetical protein
LRLQKLKLDKPHLLTRKTALLQMKKNRTH